MSAPIVDPIAERVARRWLREVERARLGTAYAWSDGRLAPTGREDDEDGEDHENERAVGGTG